MTRNEGHGLLNKLQEGQSFDFEQITAALIATGDLAGWREFEILGNLATGMRSTALVKPVEDSPMRTRDQVCKQLVGEHDPADRTNPRPWCSAYIAGRYEQGKT